MRQKNISGTHSSYWMYVDSIMRLRNSYPFELRNLCKQHVKVRFLSHSKHTASTLQTTGIMLFRKTTTVYSDNHSTFTKHLNTRRHCWTTKHWNLIGCSMTSSPPPLPQCIISQWYSSAFFISLRFHFPHGKIRHAYPRCYFNCSVTFWNLVKFWNCVTWNCF